MNIFGFKVSKKALIIIGVILVVLVVASTISSNNAKNEAKKRNEQIKAEREAQEQKEAETSSSTANLSRAELEQQAFIEEWGQPPEGFRWNRKGELVAVSSDDLTSEEVVWSYLRALSILDFSTVQKYSLNSVVESAYEGYFDTSDIGNASYYSQFLRKAYKFTLTSIEVDNVGNTAVFADGSAIVTVKLKLLDLTNKDFWLEDKDTIFNNLKNMYITEDDSTKAQQYLYDYIYSAYEGGRVGKRDITIELKLDKVNLGGWLVSDDTDLYSAVSYEDGTNITEYILEEYTDWVEDLEVY